MFSDGRVKLRVRVTPFSDASNVHEVLTQELLVLTVAQLVFSTSGRLTASRF